MPTTFDAQIPDALERLGVWLGLIATVIVSLGVIVRFGPLRWVVHTMFGEPVGRWFRSEVTQATEDIRTLAADTHHRVRHHLGSNGSTTPTHERLSRLELAVGLSPIAQEAEPTLEGTDADGVWVDWNVDLSDEEDDDG